MPKRFKIGAAKVDITPPLTIPYLSFVPRQTAFGGVHDPLYARALVCDNGDMRVAIISADALGFSEGILGDGRNFIEEVRHHAYQLTGIPPTHIMLTATHAHSTPQTTHLANILEFTPSKHWLEVLIDRMASTVALANRNMCDSSVRASAGRLQGLSRNRRAQLTVSPITDDTLTAVAFVTGNSMRAALINFACHPVTVQVQPLVSADFPGYAMTLVERITQATAALFIQGAAGQLNPSGERNFDEVSRYGLMLAGAALQQLAMAMAPDAPAMSTQLRVASEHLMLPTRDDLPPVDEAKARVKELEAQVQSANGDSETQMRLLRQLQRARDVVYTIQLCSAPIHAEVQVMRIGDIAIVGIPGELFCEYGVQIRNASPARETIIAAYANGYIGYIPTPQAYNEGGYEVSYGPWSIVSPDAGNMIVETASRLLDSLFD